MCSCEFVYTPTYIRGGQKQCLDHLELEFQLFVDPGLLTAKPPSLLPQPRELAQDQMATQ